jgi:hypothetical protein
MAKINLNCALKSFVEKGHRHSERSLPAPILSIQACKIKALPKRGLKDFERD